MTIFELNEKNNKDWFISHGDLIITVQWHTFIQALLFNECSPFNYVLISVFGAWNLRFQEKKKIIDRVDILVEQQIDLVLVFSFDKYLFQ